MDLYLVDEHFLTPKQIDILPLRAGIFFYRLCDKRCNLGKNMTVLYETKFGWIFTDTIEINQIRELSDIQDWGHVSSSFNATDVISWGATPRVVL